MIKYSSIVLYYPLTKQLKVRLSVKKMVNLVYFVVKHVFLWQKVRKNVP